MRTPHAVLNQGRFKRSTLSKVIAQATIAGALAAMAGQAQALSFDLENGMTLDVDTTLGYNVQWRTNDQDPNVLQFGGLGFLTDDGNRNFDKGDMTQNQVNFSTDLDLNYGAGGIFARARGWYDDVYNDDFSAWAFDTSYDAPYLKDGTDKHKSTIELQDLFWYHGFDLGDQYLSLRVGEQVVNWGESMFIQGGISTAMGPLDATKASAPSSDQGFAKAGQAVREQALWIEQTEVTNLEPGGSA